MTLMSGNIMLMPHGMCLVMQNLIWVNVHIVKMHKHLPHFIIMLQIVLWKHIWSQNHLFSVYEVYIKQHFLLKSIATNNLDVSIWWVYIWLPYPLFVVTMLFKFINDHILITGILWNFEITPYHHQVSLLTVHHDFGYARDWCIHPLLWI